jgi:phosphoserine aminotransferase
MARVINFNAGPAGLPLPALEKAREELLDFKGSGMSIMEHSHRGKEYEAVHNEAISLLTELLGIPDTHSVLFQQGGASMQFAVLPMNLLPKDGSADYIQTGVWGEKAIAEAKLLGKVNVAANTLNAEKKFTRVPKAAEYKFDPNAAYVHVTSNETIDGVQFHEFPSTGNVPLIADMSSDFIWKKFDVSKFGMIYAGAQKNVGPSGVAVLIMRKDLIEKGRTDIPKIFRYSTHAKENSLYNTPPTFSIYLIRNVLEWMKAQGGLAWVEQQNTEKAQLLYAAIDKHAGFYRCPVEKESRSVMNIVYRLPTEALEEKFVAEAKKAGMIGVKGHRSVGGIRISAYNAVSVDNIKTLVSFMESFARANG